MNAPISRLDPSDADILGHFESLGDNCEFGLVQRMLGIEQLGFFRLNFAKLPAVLRALNRDFADIGEPDQVELYTEASQEWMVRIRDYGFQYHTHLNRGEVDVEVLRAQQIKATRFLARKLLDDLRSAEKVFVRKGTDTVNAEQVMPLLRALRRHGPVTLLWVVQQDDAHGLGTVEVVEPGLLKGYIDRFASYIDAPDFSMVWLDICRGAYRLWRDKSPPGTVARPATPPPAGNLIRYADRFGGDGWQSVPRASARLTDAVPRLHPGCAITDHRLLEATRSQTGDIHRYALWHGLVSGSIYVASIWVWLPTDFRGQVVGVVFNGFESLRIVNARTELRQQWQRVWVSARIPAGISSANPSLYVIGPVGARVFSTCWKLELGVQPTDYAPSPPPPAAPPPAVRSPQPAAPEDVPARSDAILRAPAAPAPGRVYRCVSLPELSRLGGAQRLPYLPGSDIEMPALSYGSVELSHPAIAESPVLGAGRVELRYSPVDAYVLRDAVVHGKYGVVTCGDAVIAESTLHLPLHRIAGSEWLDDTRLRLPERPPAAVVPNAYHLLACNLDNYFHWLLEGLSRFDAGAFRGLGTLGEVGRDCRLLVPQPDAPWKRQSLDLLVPPPDIPRVAIADGATVQAARLLYVPQFAGGGWQPHRALSPVFDRMRSAAFAALGAEPAPPSRRLFVSRADSPHRRLTNAGEVEAAAAAAGFTRIVLSEISVAEQVRLFAEATHIVAPHGAGLTNLLFCRPGAAVCELQMDCYVNWAFRGLAALRGLRYGCLIGHHIPPRRVQAHDNQWRLDPAKLSEVLVDPRFRSVG